MNLFEEKEFPAILKELHSILHFVKQTGAQCYLSKEKLLKLELACEEILMNIIFHAYPDKPGSVYVSCAHDAEHFKVTIKDQGVAFDPTTAVVPSHNHLPLEQRKLGGLGILLAKHSADIMQYEYASPYNILSLIFKKDQQPPSD